MNTHSFAHGFTDFLTVDVPYRNWAVALLVGLAAYLAMSVGLRFVAARATTFAKHTTNRADDLAVSLFGATNRGLLAVAAALIGASFLDLPTRWAGRIDHLWFAAIALQFALWLNAAVAIALRLYLARHASAAADAATPVSATATLLSWGLRITLWTIVLLAILSNVGVNITAFVASLGVGGVAVALAVQNILGDLFASLSIAVDKPFEVGDAIAFAAVNGSVERIGLKTTRIRSLSGEQIIVSNTELLKQTVSNYKRMGTRRIDFKFGVSYDATAEQAGQIPAIVKRIIASSDRLRFERAHLQALGESSLDYEVVYHVLDPDYNLFMDLQQMINLRLMQELQTLGVEFAFPTRTVHVVRGARPESAREAPPAAVADAPSPPPSSSDAPPRSANASPNPG